MADDALPQSTALLVRCLETLVPCTASDEMIADARRGRYHDFDSNEPAPISLLVLHLLKRIATPAAETLAKLAENGTFDATAAEAKAWSQTDTGRAILREYSAIGRILAGD